MILTNQLHFLLIVFAELFSCESNFDEIDDYYDYPSPFKSQNDDWISVEFPKQDNKKHHKKIHSLVDDKKNYENNSNKKTYDEYDLSRPDYDHQDSDYESNFFSKKPTTNKKPTILNNAIGENSTRYDQQNEEFAFNKLDDNKLEHDLDQKLTCFDREHTCTPQTKCPLTRFEDFESIQECTLSYTQEYGVCCPPPEYSTIREQEPTNQLPISKKATKVVYPKKIRYYPNVNKNQYRALNDNYDERLKHVKQIERKLVARHIELSSNSPELAHHNFFGNHKESLRLGLKGESSISKALEIVRKYYRRMQSSQTLMSSTQIELKIANATDCPKEPDCLIGKYRTIDGSCNNMFHPSWGKSFSPYNRVLNPSYGDGINSPRLSFEKKKLPNARLVSTTVTKLREAPKSRLTLITMQFGQFIDHDFASAATTRTEQGNPISCCKPEVQADPVNLKHPACYEIQIPKTDLFYKSSNVTCMNFVRSVATPRTDCKLAPREQLNQPTAFVDGSHIYGSSKETQESLRVFEGGRLLSSLWRNIQFLPRQTNGTCNVPSGNADQCFRAGDPRVNENIDLTIFQTIFLREHNRVAAKLSKLNPSWNDEHIYQETRAIVAAEIQHILYNEFLPAVLNRPTLKKFGLLPTEEGYLTQYDHKINPMLFSGFATAAYRWHSSVRGTLQLRNNNDELIGEIPLSNTFNNPTLLTKPKVFDGLLRGMTSQPMQEIDQYFTNEMTDKLFRPWNSTFGLDIFALNVQRGRDHGLKGYPSWLKQCDLGKINHFDDLDLMIPKKLVNVLKSLYDSVYDVDLYVAGILEFHLPNSELGPLFSCMVAEQFRRLKYGDRFFYENADQVNSFTLDQLAEIKKVSLARLICDNGDYVKRMQPHVFILPKYFWNKKVSCDSELIPRMCLKPWKE